MTPSIVITDPVLAEIFRDLESQVAQDYGLQTDFQSAHEAYAFLKHELDEFWQAVMNSQVWKTEEEAMQLAAVAIRYIHQRGRKLKGQSDA